MADENRPEWINEDAPEWRGRTPIPKLERGATPIPKLVVETHPDEEAGLTPIPKSVPKDVKPSEGEKAE